MLHSLRTDKKQADLHRSILVECEIEEEAWARLVLKHGYLVEAATGMELDISLSASAVDSRNRSSSQTAEVSSRPKAADAESVQDSQPHAIEQPEIPDSQDPRVHAPGRSRLGCCRRARLLEDPRD